MAVIELFVTECIKSVLKIVEGIVEGFAKRTDRLRKHAYRLVEGLSLLDEDIAKLLDLINEAEKSGDKHFLDRFEPTVIRHRNPRNPHHAVSTRNFKKPPGARPIGVSFRPGGAGRSDAAGDVR